MKSNHLSMIAASVILGISFIIGCALVNNNKDSEDELEQTQVMEAVDKPLMNLQETAVFLNMKEEQVLAIIKAEHDTLSTARSFNGVMFPYIKVDQEYFISTKELMSWIEDASTNKRIYIKGQLY